MLRLTTLGATDLKDGLGHTIREALGQPKRLALLVYLAVEGRQGPIARERLLGLFWPGADAAKARNALSQALHHLRHAIGPDLIRGQSAAAVELNAEALWCDATAFAAAHEAGDHELALDIYRGEFCPHLEVSGAPAADEWLGAQRRRLRAIALSAARSQAERLESSGDRDGALRSARAALLMRPEDEADARALIALVERTADATFALAAYQAHVERLEGELGRKPDAETQRLGENIRRRLASGAAAPAQYLEAARAGTARRRWRAAALLAVAAATATITLSAAWSRRPRHAPPPPEQLLAVFPFGVRNAQGLAYLREGMVDLLTAKIEGATGLHAIDPRTVLAATPASDQARTGEVLARIARRFGAGRYITGDVIGVGGRLQLFGVLHDAGDGRALATTTISGDTTALFELVDDLTGRLLAASTASRDSSLTRLAAVTTHSLPALKAYLLGEQALRAGLDARAATAFQNAAEIDTAFALAQFRLAMMGTWVSIPDITVRVGDAAARAARHVERLTPLGRDLLAAYQSYKSIRIEETEHIYRGLTALHPDNVEAWFMLGETLFHYNPLRARSPQEASEAFRRVLALDPGNPHAILHLARLAAMSGRHTELDTLAAQFLARYQDAERALEMRALVAFSGEDAAVKSAVRAETRATNYLVASSVFSAAALLAQDLDGARALAPVLLRQTVDPATRVYQRRAISELDLAAGRFDVAGPARLLGDSLAGDWLFEAEAMLATDPGLPIARERITALRDSLLVRTAYPPQGWHGRAVDPALGPVVRVYVLGLLNLRLGNRAAAVAAAEQLATLHDPARAEVAQALGAGLRAEMARSSGDFSGALLTLDRFPFSWTETGPRMLMHWGIRERLLRADVLVALGRDEDAIELLESVNNSYNMAWMAPAHLMEARVLERLGRRERASFHYGRFIRLWADCDPALRPLVDEARRAQARLAAES